MLRAFQFCNSMNLLFVAFISIRKAKEMPSSSEQVHWCEDNALEQARFPNLKENTPLRRSACLTNYCLHLLKSRQAMPGTPNNLIRMIELPWWRKSSMQIRGTDWIWNAYIVQNVNLFKFQTDPEYPFLYSFNRELK